MKIIGFAQLRNEIDRGNLSNWFKSMSQICDHVYIYDQASNDGSISYYANQTEVNVTVIPSQTNDFENELICKQKLLEAVQTEHPDADWIFWMDGDTLLDGRLNRYNINKFLTDYPSADGIMLGHLNLWRSDIYYRTDNQFHALNAGVMCFWRNVDYLHFDNRPGLHKGNCPINFKNAIRDPTYTLIHRGFATDKQIIDRLESWKYQSPDSWPSGKAGIQKNWNRFFDEERLKVEQISMEILPTWFKKIDIFHPSSKEKLKDLYPKPSF